MSRMLFGGGTAQVYLYEDETGDLHAYGPLVASFYDGFDASASPVLDLLTTDGEAVTTIDVTGPEGEEQIGQLPAFYGPDEVYELWVSVNNSPRQLLRPVNVGSDFYPTKLAIDQLLGSGNPNPFGTALTDLLDVDGAVVAAADQGTSLVKLSTGIYSSGSAPIPLSDIIWVAASDAPTNFKGAPYVCDGVDDHVEINAALSNTLGLKVGLSPGNFALSSPIRMAYTGNPALALATPKSQYLIGAGQSATKLNVQAGINAGIYIYDNCGAHIWDLTINVADQRGIWAFRAGGASIDYRSMIGGSIRRVTIAGPLAGTHANWGMSLKSADNVLLEEVTMTGTKWGMEVVSEDSSQHFGNITFRNCRVTIVNDGGQCFRTGNDAGDLRQITFDTCTAGVASTTQANTEGFLISAAGGQTYGVRLLNCTSFGLATAIHTWPNVTDVDADFAFVQPAQGGTFAVVEGGSSRFRLSEFRIPSTVTAATLMTDTGISSLVNEYWHHTYTQAVSTVTGSLGNGVIRRGVHEGLGSISSTLLRSRGNMVDRSNIKTVSVALASMGTVATNFTVTSASLRTSLDGKLIYGWFKIKSTNAITATSNNIPDTLMFTLNSAYRPTESLYEYWSTGAANGGLIIASGGTITLTTGDQNIAANAIVTFSFAYIKD